MILKEKIFLRNLPFAESNRINFHRKEAFHLSPFLLRHPRLIKSTFPLAPSPQSFRRACGFLSREKSDKTVGRREERKKREEKRRGRKRWEEYDLRFRARICEAFDTPHSDFTLCSVHCRRYYSLRAGKKAVLHRESREREREVNLVYKMSRGWQGRKGDASICGSVVTHAPTLPGLVLNLTSPSLESQILVSSKLQRFWHTFSLAGDSRKSWILFPVSNLGLLRYQQIS